MDWTWLAELGRYLISDDFFKILAVISVWGFFLSGIDDLFIDLRYMYHVIMRGGQREQIRLLKARKMPEKPIAIMIPAWQEASVIRKMLMRNVTNIDYRNYHIFVGTYPNDTDTQSEVEGVIRYYRRLRLRSNMAGKGVEQSLPGDFVHMVVTPRPGPTNKADNLNAIYRRIIEVEQQLIAESDLSGPFEIFVMHDCEDVIHPQELKLFNYLMTNQPKDERPVGHKYREQYDFVQVPVFPLEISIKPEPDQTAGLVATRAKFKVFNAEQWILNLPKLLWYWLTYIFTTFQNILRYAVSATYMDEFAEHHTKDMIVRREIKGLVPSAGVGTGINRIHLEKLEAEAGTPGIFNDVHLTEDYEISLHLRNLGAKQYFMVEPVMMLKYFEGKLDETHEVEEFVATKEYFPDKVGLAIKQKTRWIMGITYQTIFPGKKDNVIADFISGWQGNFRTKYTLLRDRKALVTNYINIIGYAVFIYCLIKVILVATIDYNWSFYRIFPPSSYIWWLLLFNMVVMVERFLQRFHAVRKIYGLKHSLYFLVRTLFLVGLFLGNFINFMATIGATRRYIGYVLRSVFPSKEKETTEVSENGETTVVTTESKPKIAWGKTDHSYLSEEQMRDYVNRIGRLAIRNRLMDEDQLEEALKRQRDEHKKLGDILQDMGVVDQVGFSHLYAQQLSLPITDIDAFVIDQDLLDLIPEDVAIEYRLIPLAEDDYGNLIVAISDPIDDVEKQRLEERIERKLKFVITYESDIEFSRRRAYGKRAGGTAPVQRLGVYLIEHGYISEDQLSDALYQQKVSHKPLGEVFLDMHIVSEEILSGYFETVYGIPFKRLRADEIDTKLLEEIPRAFCSIHRAVPVKRYNGSIRFAFANYSLRDTIETIQNHFGAEVDGFLAPQDDIVAAIDTGYSRFDEAQIRARLLGSKLIAAGVIDERRLDEALKQQRGKDMRIGEVLVAYGFCNEREFLEVYSDELMLPMVAVKAMNLNSNLSQYYPRSLAIGRTIVPVFGGEKGVTFALPYDFTIEDVRAIEERFPHGSIRYILALKSEIRDAIRTVYSSSSDLAMNMDY